MTERVIGGSGVYEIDWLEGAKWVEVNSPFGTPSDAIMTAPDKRDPDMVAKLDAIAGRVL